MPGAQTLSSPVLRRRSRRWLLASVLTVSACASDGDRQDVSVVRDSAGIVIVENRDAPEIPAWHVDPNPLLEIGRAEGEGPDVFGLVRHAIRLPTGEIAVADGRAMDIRLFGSDGSHQVTFGRQGEGPGEFMQLQCKRPVFPG